jgi:hypothetical protein
MFNGKLRLVALRYPQFVETLQGQEQTVSSYLRINETSTLGGRTIVYTFPLTFCSLMKDVLLIKHFIYCITHFSQL